MQVYISKDGRQWGPYEASQVGSLIERGSFGLQDWAWIEGSAEWVPVRKILQTLHREKKAESQVLHSKVEAAKNQWREKLTQPTPAMFREHKALRAQGAPQMTPAVAGGGTQGRNVFFGALGLGLAGFVTMLALSGPNEADVNALNLENGLTYKIDSNVPFEGKAVMHYSNGQRKFEAEYQDGLRHGRVVSYYSTGARESEGTMKNGVFHGKVTFYHPNGQVKSQTLYHRGNEVSLKRWDEQGAVLLRSE
jgi:hypothetical protein